MNKNIVILKPEEGNGVVAQNFVCRRVEPNGSYLQLSRISREFFIESLGPLCREYHSWSNSQ